MIVRLIEIEIELDFAFDSAVVLVVAFAFAFTVGAALSVAHSRRSLHSHTQIHTPFSPFVPLHQHSTAHSTAQSRTAQNSTEQH